jgi:peptidyl-prolyl cis-trans isomerase B (cyclophilin B)
LRSASFALAFLLAAACLPFVPAAKAQVDESTIPPEVILSPNQTQGATTVAPATSSPPAPGGPNTQLNTMPPNMMGGRPSRVNWTAPGQAPQMPPGSAPPQGSSSSLPGGRLPAAGAPNDQGGAFGPDPDADCPGCPKKKGYKEHYYPQDAPQPPAAFNASPLAAVTPGGQVQKDPLAIIETTKGTIVIRLFRQHAPKTVLNFIDIASHGFYNSLLFHRVEPGFVVQTGCPNSNGTGGYADPNSGQRRRLGLELNPRLRHNAPGVVAMARTGSDPHSASSQFYITLSEQGRLDNKYAVFGGVIKGMDVVQRITTQDRIITVMVQEQEQE